MEEFFYTTHYPCRWNNGPTIITLNDRYEPIASLDEAEALANSNRSSEDKWGTSDECVTTYGVMYKTERFRPKLT